MVDVVAAQPLTSRPNLDQQHGWVTGILFVGLLAGGIAYAAYSLHNDVVLAGTQITSWLPWMLLGVALLIALGFEFVNGFHDTANAVATVIYTHSMPANVAVVWSGFSISSAW